MDFKTSLERYLSTKEIEELCSSLSLPDKKAIYLNTNKFSEEKLLKLFPDLKPHPVVPFGYIYDKNQYELGKKIYHDLGAYYIQEPSAMLVAHFLDAKPGDVVLDLCAAPGGKTIQTALRMQNTGLIIANDLSKSRANVLLSNIERIGISNTVISALDFKNYYKNFLNYFDKIILDAPCSGSGMFRKSDEMKNDWTYEKVLKNAVIQKELILMAYSMLKPGGRLVYSTCSYSYEEDEEIVDYLLNSSDAKLENIKDFPGIFRSQTFKETIHLFPSKFEGEGHFIALINKPGISEKTKLAPFEITRTVIGKGQKKEIQKFICPHKLPNHFEELALRPGLFLGVQNKDKFVPSHHYCRVQNNNDSIELTEEELIKYLRGETINKKSPNGYHFVCFLGMNVGVVYSLNGVLKNYYPKGLRFNPNVEPLF